MTDTTHDPLAAIEALADDWLREDEGDLAFSPDRTADLRAALTEARQAVDALVAERDAAAAKATRFAQLLAGAAKESNDALSKLAQRAEQAEAERDDMEVLANGYAGQAHALEQERDAAREALARVEALTDWHETKAEKARSYRPEVNGENLVMDKAAEVHDDAARRLRAALLQPATDEPRCDHPGIEHGQFSHTGVCPRCKECKFIGHGPLCVDCFTQPATGCACPPEHAVGFTVHQRPCPLAQPAAVPPAKCDTCDDTGRVPWMIEADPHLCQEPDAEGTIPCPDCSCTYAATGEEAGQ